MKLLTRQPGLDDDQISELTGNKPRQQVNQICRRLVNRGVLLRYPGPMGKIVNYPVVEFPRKASVPTKPIALTADQCQKSDPVRVRHDRAATVLGKGSASVTILGPASETLLILPCSAKKLPTVGVCETGPRITDYLPGDLADKLHSARSEVQRKHTKVNERTLVAACQRYDGYLYRSAREALTDALEDKLHILILSGGYGVILANEPIGCYRARLNLAWWPKCLLEDVIASYAWRHKLKRAVAVVSYSPPYRNLVEKVDWRSAGVDEAVLIMPEPVKSGAMVKSPRAQGEAISALISGKLDQGWCSSDGLEIVRKRIYLTQPKVAR